MIETKIGKIKKVSFGAGGYQDAMIGISFDLGGDGWGVGDFWGSWGHDIEAGTNSKWTPQERLNHLGETCLRISKLLSDAKEVRVEGLKDVPVEVTFNGMELQSWRVLKEVL